MDIFNPKAANGDVFIMARTNPRHFTSRKDIDALAGGLSPRKEIATQSITGNTGKVNIPFDLTAAASFRNQLLSSLEDVNKYQQEPERLSIQSIIDPDSVDAHDITVAATKAQLTLNITKNIVDRVIQAYTTIINTR